MKGSSQNKIVSPERDEKKKDILNLQEKCMCKNCDREVNNYCFIEANNDYYCIPCFSSLPKWAQHYRVINKLNFSVYNQQWTAHQQIFLFEALQKHGLGNWTQISDFIGTNKTKQDVEEHYNEIFLKSPDFLPVIIQISKDNTIIVPRSQSNSKHGKNVKHKNFRNRQSGILKRSNSSFKEKKHSKISQIQIVGYMPLRADFEFEYDNQAELLLAEMEFTDDDTPEQIQLKFKILDLYNDRLTQRNKKKQFVISRGLLDLEKQMQIEKMRPKHEKQIYNMLKIFARFHTTEDHERLVQGIIKEKILKQRIQQYKQLRNKGFKSRAEIQNELQRKYQAKSKKKSSNQYGYSNGYEGRNRRLANEQAENSLIKKGSPYFSQEQINLCKQLKLSGVSYMMIKETIIREHLKQGTLDRQQIMGMFCLDRHIINTIINYLSSEEGIVCR